MPQIEGFIRRCEEQLEQLRTQLAPLESGNMTIGSRRGNEAWRDITQERIEQIRLNIDNYEAIIERLRKRQAV
jgi:hypothetical protein